MSNERQEHGFHFEKAVIEELKLTPSSNYTHPYDAYTKDNIPVQIKFSQCKNGRISQAEMGDFGRNKEKEQDFILIIGGWEKEHHTIVEIVQFHIQKSLWNEVFQFPDYEQMKQEIKQFPPRGQCDQEWKIYCKKWKDKWDSEFRIAGLAFKRDTKKQRRIQMFIRKEGLKYLEKFCDSFKKWSRKEVERVSKRMIEYKRKSLDKYYTNPGIIPPLLDAIHLSKYDCVVEPSAGDGSFTRLLEQVHPTVLSYDISPDSTGIVQLDFLNQLIDLSPYKNVAVIGNPPFGRQCSLAVKFFNRAASYPQVSCIGMIFPKSFRKDSIQRRLSLDFKHSYEVDIPPHSFTANEQPVDIPCIFQIWNRTPVKRKCTPRQTLQTNGISFVKKKLIDTSHTDQYIAIRRVGFYAGKAFPYENQGEQPFYFLHIQPPHDPTKIIEYMNSITWEFNDTVGSRSISKQQFINQLNRINRNKN